jgi:hypothetical protein
MLNRPGKNYSTREHHIFEFIFHDWTYHWKVENWRKSEVAIFFSQGTRLGPEILCEWKLVRKLIVGNQLNDQYQGVYNVCLQSTRSHSTCCEATIAVWYGLKKKDRGVTIFSCYVIRALHVWRSMGSEGRGGEADRMTTYRTRHTRKFVDIHI